MNHDSSDLIINDATYKPIRTSLEMSNGSRERRKYVKEVTYSQEKGKVEKTIITIK